LIDSHPHQVSIRCQAPRQLAQKLIDSDFVSSVDFGNDGHSLTVKTNQRDLFFTALIRLIAETGLEIEEITTPDDNLQAVFDYLIGK
jgi:ABC-2 type transport system ATP-binding protein